MKKPLHEDLFLKQVSTWGIKPDGPGIYTFPPNSLTGLIFGIKTEPSHRDQIKDIVRSSGLNIRLYQARQHKADFKIEIEEMYA